MWLIYALSAAAIWGLDYSLGERILRNKISPITLMAIQMGIGSVVFLCVGQYSTFKSDLPLIAKNSEIFWLTLAAVVSFNLGNFLIFISIQAKNATVAGLIELCYPIFTALFTYFLFKENHFNLGILFGTVLVIAGILVIGVYGG